MAGPIPGGLDDIALHFPAPGPSSASIQPDSFKTEFHLKSGHPPTVVMHQTCLVLWTWRKLANETNAKNAPKIC